MGFTNQERINANTNALQANVLDSNPTSQWYEKLFPFEFALPNTKIFTQLASVPSANTLYVARNNATSNPTIISDLSKSPNATRLTTISGTNDFTWVSYSVYNDASSPRLDNWIQPQLIPQASGLASTGYAIGLYNGQPIGAVGTFQVTNFANLVNGVSTITIQDYLGNLTVFTAVSSGATGQQFNIGSDNNDTASNIASVINNYVGFSAQVNGGTSNQVDVTQLTGGTEGNGRTIITNQATAIGSLVNFSGGTGTLITTSDGQTGSGVNASVGWIWNYTVGMLLLSQDFFTQTGITKATFDPYINGFRYIGETAGSTANVQNVRTDNLVADESIAIGDVVRLVQFGEAGTVGRVVKSNATAQQSQEVYVALTSAAAQGDNVQVAIVGEINVNFGSSVPSNDNGKRCYLSDSTSGQATTTAPTSSGSLIVALGTISGANGSTSTPKVIFRPNLVMQNG